jgi:hypothetical protein
MLTKEILKANNWPDSYTNSVERVLYLLERHDEIELLRIVAGVFEARYAVRSQPGTACHRQSRARDLGAKPPLRSRGRVFLWF